MNAHAPLFASLEAVPTPSSLRAYQAEALAMVRREVRAGKRRIMLQMPTGAGKTQVAAAICEGALSKGNRAIFTVPMLSLVNQTVSRFRAEGIVDIGVQQAQHFLTNRAMPVQVASLQTFVRRRNAPPGVLLVDEGHVRNAALMKLLGSQEWRDVPVIGLSATPWASGMARDWECLLTPVTMAELIRDGWLAPYRIFAPSHPDLSGVKVRAGDYADEALSEVMGDGKLVADIVETWKALGEMRPTICFAVDLAHARKIEREFIAADIRAEYADAQTPPDERDAIGERLRTGETQVVTNCGVFGTGTDWPWVSCLILARPSKSHALFVQQIGRGLRPYGEGKVCLVLDHASNTLNLGFPDTIHFEELDSGESKSGPQPRQRNRDERPRECPRCKRVRRAGEYVCPSCGAAPRRESKIQCEEGELFEIDSSRKQAGMTHGQKQRFYSELQGYAKAKEKSERWVLAQYKSKTKCWPRGLIPHAIEPTPETIGWLRSRQIAWAKRKVA